MPPPPGPASSLTASPDLRRQPIAPRLGGFDRRDVVLEHDMMHRLLELEPRQPAAMQLGPGRSPVMAAVTQHEARELLASATASWWSLERFDCVSRLRLRSINE